MAEFRVLVVGESPEWGDALVARFREHGAFEVVGTWTEREGLVDEVARCRPDVVVWNAPGGSGSDSLRLAAELRSRCPFTIPIVLVDQPERLELDALLRAGVRGCLPLRLRPAQIVAAAELIARAELVCFPQALAEPSGPRREEETGPRLEFLSPREKRVLELLGENLSNKEIAAALFISESTVKSHLASIYRKLGARNRTEAAMLAFRAGLGRRQKPLDRR